MDNIDVITDCHTRNGDIAVTANGSAASRKYLDGYSSYRKNYGGFDYGPDFHGSLRRDSSPIPRNDGYDRYYPDPGSTKVSTRKYCL